MKTVLTSKATPVSYPNGKMSEASSRPKYSLRTFAMWPSPHAGSHTEWCGKILIEDHFFQQCRHSRAVRAHCRSNFTTPLIHGEAESPAQRSLWFFLRSGAASLSSLSLFSPRPAPFQLKGTHLPLDYLRTPARLSRGRTIFFASGVVAVCGSARSPAHAGGTRQNRQG